MSNRVIHAILDVFVVFLVSSDAFIYRDGVVQPDSPFVTLGQSLILNCTITNYQGPEDSSSLFFMHRQNRVVRQVRIKNKHTLELRVLHVQHTHDGVYTCVLKLKDGSDKVIGKQIVTIDYALEKVKAISCRVFNWEKMTCTWKVQTSYFHPENINTTLVWAINKQKQVDCPMQKRNKCTWSWNDEQKSFKRDDHYYMIVIIENVKTFAQAKSKLAKIKSSEIVEPAAVSSIETYNTNSTCVHLKWQQISLNDQGAEKVFKVQFISETQPGKRKDGIRETSYDMCGLVPYTMYTVKINCKTKQKGFWSKDAEIQLRTAKDVPTYSPPLAPGNYAQLSDKANVRRVVFFWKPIDSQSINGQIVYYRISYTDSTNGHTAHVDVTDGRTNGILTLRSDIKYRIEVTGWTSVGPSKDPMPITIPAVKHKPAFPVKFIARASVRKGKTDVTLSWLPPPTGLRSFTHYTVYWCVGDYIEKTCNADIHWTIVLASLTSYSVQLPGVHYDRYMYGISADNDRYSSGVLWSRCTFLKKLAPVAGPKNFRLADEHPDYGLSVLWTEYGCKESGYIDYYVLSYCHTDDSDCAGTEHTQRIDGGLLEYIITDLEAEVTYLVWLVGVSDGGASLRSKQLRYTVVSPQGFSTAHMAGIIVAGLVLLCLLFCLIFCIVRRIHKKDENTAKLEFTEPPPLPNIQFNCGAPLKYMGKYDSLPPSPTSQTPFLSDREMTPMSTVERANKRTDLLPMNDLNAERCRKAPGVGPRVSSGDGYTMIDHDALDTLPSLYSRHRHHNGVTTFLGGDTQLAPIYSPRTDVSRMYVGAAGEDSGIVDQSEHESCDLGPSDLLENSTTKLLPSTDDETEKVAERQDSRDSSGGMSRSGSRDSCASSRPSTRSSTPRLRHFANRPLPQLPTGEDTLPYHTTDIIDMINKTCSDDDTLAHEYHVIESDDGLTRSDSRSRAVDFSHYVIDPNRHAATLQPKLRSPLLGVGARLAKTDDENVVDIKPLRVSQSLHDQTEVGLSVDDRPPVSDYMFHLPLQYYQDPLSRDDLPSTEL